MMELAPGTDQNIPERFKRLRFASGFDDTRAHKQALGAEGWLAHSFFVALKVFRFVGNGFGKLIGG